MAPIKSHKEPPDHKMDIKVGLHLDHVVDGDVHSPAEDRPDPSAPRSTLCQHLSEPLSSSLLARLSILRTLSTPSAPTPYESKGFESEACPQSKEQNAPIGGGRVGTSRRACNEWRIQAGHPNDSGAPPQSPFKVEAISTATTNVVAHVRTVFALSVEPEGQRRLDNP